MNLSAPFIRRPVATTLLTIGLALAGFFAYLQLPVSPLPQVDFPTISVQAHAAGRQPGDDGDAASRRRSSAISASIADVTEMTSSSSVGTTRITLQFGLNRDIDGAARDVQAAINAARADLPASLRSNPTYRKVNPADAPILILALTSDDPDAAARSTTPPRPCCSRSCRRSTASARSTISGSSLPAVRVELNPRALFKYGIGLEDVRAALASANANSPKGAIEDGDQPLPDLHQRPGEPGRPTTARWSSPTATARRCGCPTSPRSSIRSRICAITASPTASPRCW